MGSEVAKQSDHVAEGNAPTRGGGHLGVDLADPQSVRSVFGHNPLSEVEKSGNLPEFGGTQGMNDLTAGKPANILGPAAKAEGITLPGMALVEDGRNVTNEQDGGTKKKAVGADQGPPSDAAPDQPQSFGLGGNVLRQEEAGKRPPQIPGELPAADRSAAPGRPQIPADVTPPDQVPGGQPAEPGNQLKQNTLDAGMVRRKEGYYQVADRLLGDGFDHNQKMELTSALKDSWKSNPKNDPNELARGDALLTQNNLDPVLNSIKDTGLRERMRERLTTAELAPTPEGQTRRAKGNPEGESQGRRQRESTPDRDAAPDRSSRGRRGRETPADPARSETRPDRGSETPPDRRVLNPEPEATPTDRPGQSQGERSRDPNAPLKSPFLRRYEEGDRFKGQTSVYSEGSQTASGLPFHRNEMTAASKEFPFGTILKVTNPDNGKEVRVVVTDHGPFAGGKVQRPDGGTTHRRVLDISLGAANALGMGNTVKPLEIAVDSLPAQGRWGSQRQNIHGDYRKQVQEDVRRLSRRA